MREGKMKRKKRKKNDIYKHLIIPHPSPTTAHHISRFVFSQTFALSDDIDWVKYAHETQNVI